MLVWGVYAWLQLYMKSVRSDCILGVVGFVALLGISDFIWLFVCLFGCFVGCWPVGCLAVWSGRLSFCCVLFVLVLALYFVCVHVFCFVFLVRIRGSLCPRNMFDPQQSHLLCQDAMTWWNGEQKHNKTTTKIKYTMGDWILIVKNMPAKMWWSSLHKLCKVFSKDRSQNKLLVEASHASNALTSLSHVSQMTARITCKWQNTVGVACKPIKICITIVLHIFLWIDSSRPLIYCNCCSMESGSPHFQLATVRSLQPHQCIYSCLWISSVRCDYLLSGIIMLPMQWSFVASNVFPSPNRFR